MNPFASRYEVGSFDNSLGVAVFSGATANTKGSYVEVLASAAYDAQGFFIWTQKAGHSDADVLLDIAIGAAASETIIVNNLMGAGSGNGECTQYYIPIPVPAGTRVSARAQSTGVSDHSKVGLCLASGHPGGWSGGIVTTYGANTADSGGVSVDPGATANTKGAYSEYVASTTYDIKALILSIGEQTNFVRSSAGQRADLAVGAAGSEVVVIPDILFVQSASGDHFMPKSFHYRTYIPAGSRIALRAQSSTNDAADRLFDTIIYGIS